MARAPEVLEISEQTVSDDASPVAGETEGEAGGILEVESRREFSGGRGKDDMKTNPTDPILCRAAKANRSIVAGFKSRWFGGWARASERIAGEELLEVWDAKWNVGVIAVGRGNRVGGGGLRRREMCGGGGIGIGQLAKKAGGWNRETRARSCRQDPVKRRGGKAGSGGNVWSGGCRSRESNELSGLLLGSAVRMRPRTGNGKPAWVQAAAGSPPQVSAWPN